MGNVKIVIVFLTSVVGVIFSEGTGTEENVCLQPQSPGNCYAYFPSYFYNSSSGTCESFVYGGCGGNNNRFDSEAECMQRCRGVVAPENPPEEDRCLQPPVSGLCLAYFSLYFYNASLGSCQTFIYGGCGGNNNRFITERACLDACQGVTLDKRENDQPGNEVNSQEPQSQVVGEIQESNAEAQSQDSQATGQSQESQASAQLQESQTEGQPQESQSSVSETCRQPMKVGPCKAAFPRFYFNGFKCDRFTYGGCQGNENNFRSEEACVSACVSRN